MSYTAQVDKLLRDANCVCGISGGSRGFDISPHPTSGLVLELLEGGNVVKRTHYELPAGNELDEAALLAAHAAAYHVGDAWETERT
jgi:hypothetical protein